MKGECEGYGFGVEGVLGFVVFGVEGTDVGWKLGEGLGR